MELRVFDKTVQPLGAIDELASLLWHTKYFDVGTFSLLAPITDNNSRLLVEGNLITKHDGKKEVKTADGGVWRRAAQITYVHITKDENGLEQLEAQGYMLSWWLNKRCIYPQIVATGTNQYLIKGGYGILLRRGSGRYEIRSGRRIRHGAGSNTYPDRRGSGSRRGRKRQNSPYTFQSGKSGLQGNCAGTHRHRGRNDNRRHCSTERSIKAV